MGGPSEGKLYCDNGASAFDYPGAATCPQGVKGCAGLTENPYFYSLDTKFNNEGNNGIVTADTRGTVYGHTCPIFVPSKGRFYHERGTLSLLIGDMVPFSLVVEKEEEAQYRELVDRLISRFWGEGADRVSHSGARTKLRKEEGATPRRGGSRTGNVPPSVPAVLQQQVLAGSELQMARNLVKIEVLPSSGRGVAYVRNYILRKLAPAAVNVYANAGTPSCKPNSVSPGGRSHAAQWYWVMDDDIAKFFVAADKKSTVITAREALKRVYSRIQRLHGTVCDMNEVAVFSLEYNQFAYAYGDSDVKINGYNTVASLYRHDLLPRCCEFRFPIREDYDFTLQVIAHGLKTARFRNLSFAVPTMGGLAGGMTEYYKNKKDDICQQNKLFVRTWPSVAQECVKGKGVTLRNDIRVLWGLLGPKCNTVPSLTLQSRSKLPRASNRNANSATRTSSLRATITSLSKAKKTSAATKVLVVQRSKAKTFRGGAYARRKAEGTDDGGGDCSTQGVTSAVREAAEVGNANGEESSAWKGYVMKKWRYLTNEEAKGLHLTLLPPEKLRCGDTVAVVMPYLEQHPSVVRATLIEKTYKMRRMEVAGEDGEVASENGKCKYRKVVEWEVAPDNFPLMMVSCCYEVPPEGVEVAAAAVDAFFGRGGSQAD
uniref:TET-Associated Glycosyltransferase domain-containing protein n=1 Tax=Trypanosoma brucei brucei (strain 927/4 GUTat10.1) TaxID=185431 RepID=Q4FKJ3_TRYB2|nr:hypothetical protein Tb10.v4.0246 [Trypanosoma brucei brucei TREU927]